MAFFVVRDRAQLSEVGQHVEMLEIHSKLLDGEEVRLGEGNNVRTL